MRNKEEILASVHHQNVSEETLEQYQIRIHKRILEVLIDIRDNLAFLASK